MIGFNDVKTDAGVYFHVGRKSEYSSIGTVIPYEWEHLNIGAAMNLATGVFIAPVNGRYYFSFTARSGTAAKNWISLRVNGVQTGISHAPQWNHNIPIVTTLDLVNEDTVDIMLVEGSIFDSNNHNTHFSGVLLEEDLSL